MEMSIVITDRPGREQMRPGRGSQRPMPERVPTRKQAATAGQAASSYVRDNIRSHIAGRLRRFDLSATVARAVGDGLRDIARDRPIEADILATLTAIGDPRLVQRAIAALAGLTASLAAAGTCLACRLTLARGGAVLILDFPAGSDAAPAEPGGPPPRVSAMSASSARLLIEEHGGSVRSFTARGNRSGLEVRFPASLS